MKTDCLLRRLPPPDAYENHWLGEKPCGGPAIFRALVKDRSVNPPADRGLVRQPRRPGRLALPEREDPLLSDAGEGFGGVMGGPELTALAAPVDSSRLQRLLRALFVRQARAVAGQIGLAGLDSGQIPDLTGWNAPLAQALKPTLLAYWLTGMLRARAGREGSGLRSYEPGNESIFGLRKGVMSYTGQSISQRLLRILRSDSLQVTKANVAAPLAVPTHFGLLSPRVLDAVDAATFAFCRETNATATQELGKALQALRVLFKRGLSRGEAGRLMAREVRRIFADPYRAERIAVTESSRFLHGGRLMAARDAGVAYKRWRASADACGSCRALDGTEVGLDEAFHVDPRGGAYAVINFPPFHPFCGCSFEEVV